VGPGRTGFFARAGQDWEDSLCLVLEDESLRARMGEAGRARVEEYFSLEKTAPRLSLLLREVASSKK